MPEQIIEKDGCGPGTSVHPRQAILSDCAERRISADFVALYWESSR